MPTRYPELFAELAAPFEPTEVKTRTQGGRVLSYVTARTVMNRLDTVLGPENWSNAYVPAGASSVLCSITIRLPDGSTVTKSDCGGAAGMADEGDDDKSSHSDALKRAAVLFCVVRYLYRDGVPRFVEAPVQAPAAEVPAPTTTTRPRPEVEAAAASAVPATARAFYLWLKSREVDNPGLMGRLAKWAEARKFPVRILAWDRAIIEEAYGNILEAIAEGHIPPTATHVNGAYPRRNGKS